jgi:hypothetical protein
MKDISSVGQEELLEAGGLHEGVAIVAEQLYKELNHRIGQLMVEARRELVKKMVDFMDNNTPLTPCSITVPHTMSSAFLMDNIETPNLKFSLVFTLDPEDENQELIKHEGGAQDKENGHSLIMLYYSVSPDFLHLSIMEMAKTMLTVTDGKNMGVIVHELKHDYESNKLIKAHGGKVVVRKSHNLMGGIEGYKNDLGHHPLAAIFGRIQIDMYKTSQIEEKAIMAQLAYDIRRTKGITKDKMIEIVKKSRVNEVVRMMEKENSKSLKAFIIHLYDVFMKHTYKRDAMNNDSDAIEYAKVANSSDKVKERLVNTQGGAYLSGFVNAVASQVEFHLDNSMEYKGVSDKEFKAYKKVFMNKSIDKIADAMIKHIQKRTEQMKRKMLRVASINYYLAIKNDKDRENIEKSNLKHGPTGFRKAHPIKP